MLGEVFTSKAAGSIVWATRPAVAAILHDVTFGTRQWPYLYSGALESRLVQSLCADWVRMACR
ncbi:MAG: hypothetical protein KGL75_02775, partial [Acidobacteriota bacterium]|nr:hypothetical protein [Acidobacteriota bacterium]